MSVRIHYALPLFCLMLVIRKNTSRPDFKKPVTTVITDLTQLKRGENIYKIKAKIAIRKSTSTFGSQSEQGQNLSFTKLLTHKTEVFGRLQVSTSYNYKEVI